MLNFKLRIQPSLLESLFTTKPACALPVCACLCRLHGRQAFFAQMFVPGGEKQGSRSKEKPWTFDLAPNLFKNRIKEKG